MDKITYKVEKTDDLDRNIELIKNFAHEVSSSHEKNLFAMATVSGLIWIRAESFAISVQFENPKEGQKILFGTNPYTGRYVFCDWNYVKQFESFARRIFDQGYRLSSNHEKNLIENAIKIGDKRKSNV